VASSADELLKTPEVAKLLRVHPKHVYRLLARGLPARRVGSEWRFLRGEVLAWAATQGGAREPASIERTPKLDVTSTPAPLLAANGDVVIEILLGLLVAEKKPLVGFVQADRAAALERLAAREILAAGHHGDRAPLELASHRLARLHLVRREIGLAYVPGKKLTGLASLAKKRVASRPPTAGVRGHLDRALAKEGLSLAEMRAKVTEVASHRDAVCAVVRGDADVALATTAWASRVGLAMLPIGHEDYELLMFAETLGDRAAVGLCELSQGSALLRALRGVAGYDPRDLGSIRYIER
jgi:excisionase family DNA binding protein